MFSFGMKIGNTLRPSVTGSSSAVLSTDVSPLGNGGGQECGHPGPAVAYLAASPPEGSMRAGVPALPGMRRELVIGDGVGKGEGFAVPCPRYNTGKQGGDEWGGAQEGREGIAWQFASQKWHKENHDDGQAFS